MNNKNQTVSTNVERLTPQSNDSEMALLGAMILEKQAIFEVKDTIVETDFYKEIHKLIFRSIIEIYTRNEPVDIVTLTEELQKLNNLNKIGGREYLQALTYQCPSAANVQQYLSVVYNKSIQRAYLENLDKSMADVYNCEDNVSVLKENIEKRIISVGNRSRKVQIETLEHLGKITFEEITKQYNKDDKEKLEPLGIPTGFKQLDDITCGLQPDELILIAARPSMGKSAFMLQVAYNSVKRTNRPGVIYSLEMSKKALYRRLLSLHSGIGLSRIKKGLLSSDEFDRLEDCVKDLGKYPLIIDDKRPATALDLSSRSRSILAEYSDLSFTMVDYIGIMGSHLKTDNVVEKISENIRCLKNTANELNCPSICLAQLNRNLGGRDDKRPNLMDLKGSGALEEVSDTIMFIHREKYHQNKDEYGSLPPSQNPSTVPEDAEIIIAKQRDGEVGTIYLGWQPDFAKFVTIEREPKRIEKAQEVLYPDSYDDPFGG